MAVKKISTNDINIDLTLIGFNTNKNVNIKKVNGIKKEKNIFI
ncbi:hypothetical protein [Brachyspira innocens]|nr:hypothetical protein [Brachyspira innocens]